MNVCYGNLLLAELWPADADASVGVFVLARIFHQPAIDLCPHLFVLGAVSRFSAQLELVAQTSVCAPFADSSVAQNLTRGRFRVATGNPARQRPNRMRKKCHRCHSERSEESLSS
jgi:hypothetical protein